MLPQTLLVGGGEKIKKQETKKDEEKKYHLSLEDVICSLSIGRGAWKTLILKIIEALLQMEWLQEPPRR